jgi:2-polyprenyl-3-methyl-5-hydroxy-6-metoxy-1,4-benzoquinol methylase
MGEKNDNFDRYLSTAFAGKRDVSASYKFYDGEYGNYLPPDKECPILDLGCGTGEFIAYLKARGHRKISGIDASGEMVEFCRRSGISHVEAVSDTADYLLRNAGSFALVVMNDVIEHLPKRDTLKILTAVKASLKEGGTLLLRTGNFSTLGGMYLRYKDFTHEIGYTESSLEQVLALAGFVDIRVWGNKAYVNLKNPISWIRAATLAVWFFIVRMLYTVELGCDRPRIYSKLLVAACKR